MLNDAFTLHGLCLMLDMMADRLAVLPSPSGSVATPEERQQLLRAQDASQAAQRELERLSGVIVPIRRDRKRKENDW